ncbi:TonB-dependent receptor [Pseudopedobacter sp.]|uniref:TonB-dependent receptor n=1 Tax=Pseudopedobacter sp. TaxID=1936787 RepID=UPI0033407FA9
MKFTLYGKVGFKSTLPIVQILRVMKLTALLITVVSLQLSASGVRSQTISLSGSNVSLERIFSAIEKQSGYFFFYKYKEIENARPVNVNLRNVTLQQALEQAFNGQPFVYSIEDKTIIVKKISEKKSPVSLPIDIKGKVTDEKGEPLPGATIRVKNTTQVLMTDTNGDFSVKNLDVDAILIVSYTGFAQKEIPVNGRTQITIALSEDMAKLNEVVVVGYGTQERSNLTGAVEQISSKDLELRPVANIATSLQGLLPGLNIQSNNGNPGSNPDINIRGFNSINGGKPLVLIDGIEGDIDRVNPIDIENVTVLKDAASSAIYGARGAFGVILITTKKGKEGEMTLNYSNNFGTSTPTARRDFLSDPYLFAKNADAGLNAYNGTTYTGYTSEEDWEKLRKVAAGELAPFRELQPDGTYKFFASTDWYSYLFRKWQPTETHNLSLSGGSNKLKGYLSGRYFKTSGIQNIVNAPLNKYNAKATLTFQATKWLEITNDTRFAISDQKEYGGFRTDFGNVFGGSAWQHLHAFHPNKINGVPFSFTGGGAHAALEDKSNWMRLYSEQLINTFSARATPLKGMVLNFDYSNRINHIANTTRMNTFSQLTGSDAHMETVGVNRLTEDRNRNYYNALNIYGTYRKDVARDHHFKLMLGYNQEEYESDNIVTEQGGLLYNDLANLNLGTELLRGDGSASVWAVQGIFGRFNYDYKNRYLLEVNARYDGSSRFPSESRWGFFPSVSGGWYLSREKFWKPIQNIVNSFKIRASYGELGNQNVELNTFTQTIGLGQRPWLVNGSKLNYAGLPSPLPGVVSWEKTKTINVGTDLSFLQNKLTASFDWYEKSTSGMYLPGEPLPAVFGAAVPKENIASLRNRGFELSFGYNDKFELSGSSLNIRATASVYNFNGVITKYPNPNGIMSTLWEGQQLGQIWGYRVAGQFQSDQEAIAYMNSFANPTKDLGQVYYYIMNVVQNAAWKGLRAGDIKFLDLNGDGAINKGDYTLENHGDIRPIGNAMPQFPFGFSFGADWKGFDLSMAGAGVVRQDWYPTGHLYWGSYYRPYLSFVRKDLFKDAWSPENPGGKYPQIERAYAAQSDTRSLATVNDYYLTNLGYLRIKNIMLGYTLPQKLTQKVNVQRLRVYFSGENMFTWSFGGLTKYMDPEQAGSGIGFNEPKDAVGRSSSTDWPIAKTYSIGVLLTL